MWHVLLLGCLYARAHAAQWLLGGGYLRSSLRKSSSVRRICEHLHTAIEKEKEKEKEKVKS
jgi:hypothetical protein